MMKAFKQVTLQNTWNKTPKYNGTIFISFFIVNLNIKSRFLITGGIIAGIAAIWHLLCIFGGPNWMIFARAPASIIESSRQGTMLAPIGSTIVAVLMFTCTAYAFSGAGLLKKIPLLTPALLTISVLCLLRGLIVLPRLIEISFSDTWQVVASSVWFFVGVCYLIGSIDVIISKD